jgi:hypothetical protein
MTRADAADRVSPQGYRVARRLMKRTYTMLSRTLHRFSVGLVRRTWLVTLATVTICASFAAHAATALIDARYPSPLPEARPVPMQPRPAAARARPDGESLVERNMFCSTCRPGAPDPAAGLPALDARLIATSLGREPCATLVLPASAVQGAWGVGDAIPGLGRVDRIAPTWIEVIDAAGHRGRLSLLDAAAGRGPDTGNVADAPWSERIRKLDDQTYEVDRSLLRELVGGTTRPGGVRPVPLLDHGEIAGVRLFGVAAGSIPAAIGLRTGDTLTAINGAPIKRLQQLLDLYAGLDQLTAVEVSGTRAGQPLVRTLRLR